MRIESGKWYWYFDCRKCNKPVPFLQDESKGKIELIAAAPRAIAEVICQACGKKGRYLLAGARSEEANALWLSRPQRLTAKGYMRPLPP